MKNSLFIGLICCGLYGLLVISVPHDFPRTQGMETDVLISYVNGAYALDNFVKHRRLEGLWQGLEPMSIQGAGYPLTLWAVGGLFSGQRGWNYWQAAKGMGIISAMAVILLLFVWLGTPAGLIASVALAVNALFFEMTYGGGTDVFVLALSSWATYALYRRKFLCAGLLLGLACITRYEFLIFLPFAVWYMFREGGVGLSWKQLSVFVLPVAGFFLLNFQIAEFPPSGGTYNVALHYLNAGASPDQVTEKALTDHPTVLSIITASPMTTVWIFLRDLYGIIAKFGSGLVLAPLLILALGFIVRKEFYQPLLPLVAALSVHFLVIAFIAYHWQTIRYFLPEILFLTAFGAMFLRGWFRWQIIIIPFLIYSLTGLANNILDRIGQSGEPFREFTGLVPSGKRVLSLRPTAAFINGWEWRYWKSGIDLYAYCLEHGIDYVQWGGMEIYNRPEYKEKLNSAQRALPEFSLVHFNQHTGLYRVNVLAAEHPE